MARPNFSGNPRAEARALQLKHGDKPWPEDDQQRWDELMDQIAFLEERARDHQPPQVAGELA